MRRAIFAFLGGFGVSLLLAASPFNGSQPIPTTQAVSASSPLGGNGTSGTPLTCTTCATTTNGGALSASAPIALSAGGAISCAVASGSVAGCLASADWTTFNGKQQAITVGSAAAATDSNGITLSSGTLATEFADSTHAGIVKGSGSQTFNVAPTFNGALTTVGGGSSITAGGNMVFSGQLECSGGQPFYMDTLSGYPFVFNQVNVAAVLPAGPLASLASCNGTNGHNTTGAGGLAWDSTNSDVALCTGSNWIDIGPGFSTAITSSVAAGSNAISFSNSGAILNFGGSTGMKVDTVDNYLEILPTGTNGLLLGSGTLAPNSSGGQDLGTTGVWWRNFIGTGIKIHGGANTAAPDWNTCTVSSGSSCTASMAGTVCICMAQSGTVTGQDCAISAGTATCTFSGAVGSSTTFTFMSH